MTSASKLTRSRRIPENMANTVANGLGHGNRLVRANGHGRPQDFFQGVANSEASEGLKGISFQCLQPTCGTPAPLVVFHSACTKESYAWCLSLCHRSTLCLKSV